MKWIVKNYAVKVGGEQPTGWLPDTAAVPPPTQEREIICDFAIEEVTGGFLLLYESHNEEFYADTWHETKEEALTVALDWYDIPFRLWAEETD